MKRTGEHRVSAGCGTNWLLITASSSRRSTAVHTRSNGCVQFSSKHPQLTALSGCEKLPTRFAAMSNCSGLRRLRYSRNKAQHYQGTTHRIFWTVLKLFLLQFGFLKLETI